MKRPGPLLTLLAGLVLGLFLLTLNATTGTKTASSAQEEKSPSPTPARSTAAPTPTPSPTPTRAPVLDADYSGHTDDKAATVGVKIRDGKAVAYFCDGRTKESWLRGPVQDDGTMTLTGKNGAKLDGTLQDGKEIDGTVDVGGGHYTFTAENTKKPAGLYRATSTVASTSIDGGWIVLKDGSQVGIVTRDGKPSPAPRIDPETGAVTIDGEQLTALPVNP
ncbi:hypothetical protein ACWCPF_23950 [Streptomyces sp. NPDC001858]